MPLPKRRHSPTRGRKRRTHWKIAAPSMVKCDNCSATKLPHHVCPACGHYKGNRLLKVSE